MIPTRGVGEIGEPSPATRTLAEAIRASVPALAEKPGAQTGSPVVRRSGASAAGSMPSFLSTGHRAALTAGKMTGGETTPTGIGAGVDG
ncbi:MAG TPA: hypothetical protein VE173_07045 [Longimicrobiales bacterium]|nr:hypothetical protein [Longimicrobiales bacterium]